MSPGHQLVAAGGLLWRLALTGRPEICVLHRPRYDDWSFPKGKPHGNESLTETAVREIREETGRRAVLGRRLPDTVYRTGEGTKRVSYWTAQALDGEFRPGEEVDEVRWLDAESAAVLLSHAHDRSLLGAVDVDRLPGHRTVLVVRHGKAGKRANWARPDHLRPLNAAGRRQAEALSTRLSHFGAGRLHSAPLVRCSQTLEPYARSLELPIADEPLLSEAGYWPTPEVAVRRVRELVAADSRPVAICSQGGVIPDLLQRLTSAAGAAISDFPSRKGSMWVLTFASDQDGPTLVATDHHPDPFD